jgi:hypothetical protein
MLGKKGTSIFKVQQNRVECSRLENVCFQANGGSVEFGDWYLFSYLS